MNGFGTFFPLESLLDPGEKLLWNGQPKQGVRLQATDIIMIPFSLVWGGFAIFWEATALGIVQTHHQMQSPGNAQMVAWFFPLWGIPFVVIGLYMIFGRFFYDASLRKGTYYGLTNQRLIILKSLFNRKINSFDYATLTSLNLVDRGDGSGDILFGTPNSMPFVSSPTWSGTGRCVIPGFYLLPDARNVYNQIRDAQQRARK